MSIDILIVDDSAVMRAMIKKALRMAGLELGEVHQAGNGAEGLEALAQHSVDLAMIDINMPVMGGEEMIERLRENPELSKLPLIVVSTEASETRIAHLEETGVRFIHKPFTPEQVREVVESVIGGSSE